MGFKRLFKIYFSLNLISTLGICKWLYDLIVNAKGSKAFDKYATLMLQVYKNVKKKNILIKEVLIETTETLSDYYLPFSLEADHNISFKVIFTNDTYRQEPKEDRNAFIQSISVKKSKFID